MERQLKYNKKSTKDQMVFELRLKNGTIGQKFFDRIQTPMFRNKRYH